MPGGCGFICSRNSSRSSAMTPPAVTMLIVTTRLAIIIIAEVKPAGRRPQRARPDSRASGLWLHALLDLREEFLISHGPAVSCSALCSRKVGFRTYVWCTDLRAEAPLHAGQSAERLLC